MKSTLMRSVLSLGVFSAIAFAALPFSSQPAVAQTSKKITIDGNLNEYSPETAPLLVLGIESPALKDVQLFLSELGFYNGAVDGVYGPGTHSAVVSFQKSRNLNPNGAITDNTWQALIDAENRIAAVPVSNIDKYEPVEAPILTIGSRGPVVRDVQGFLKQEGYYTGAVDGIYGSSTAVAVESFQQRHNNLNNDGIVGINTWEVMVETARNPFI